MKAPALGAQAPNLARAIPSSGHFDHTNADPDIVAAGQGLETVFIDYMMKVMRETVPENEMGLDSPASKIYQSMLDSETAQKSAKLGGVGLGDMVIDYLQRQRYNQGRRDMP